MKDIANRLGVSVALVSYVLNGKKPIRLMTGLLQKSKHLRQQ